MAPLATSTEAEAKATSFLKATVAQVSSTMGVKATAVSSITRGKVTMCSCTVATDTSAVTIEVVTSTTLAAFKAGMKFAKTVGQAPKTDA